MRQDHFLRTPIRADHQNRMLNLSISEQALARDPLPADPYPQTLAIAFDTAAATTEVQVALPWEGLFYFFPDDTTHLPTTIADVTQANFPGWSLAGDLVLHTFDPFLRDEQAFAAHVPLITPPPLSVRYTKVRITSDFLFVTLPRLPRISFVYEAKKVDMSDPLWLQKFIIVFLHGRGAVPCLLNNADPTQDFTLNPMPSVLLNPAGTTTFRVTMAIRADEVNNKNWFTQRDAYDNLFGEQLVDPALDNYKDQLYNPAHPSHSVVPACAVYQNADAAAYALDHTAAAPLRVALSAARPDGRTYRRIEAFRPPAPGTTTTSFPQRPYPMHQLAWLPVAGGGVESLRIPLNGRLYLPLTDGDYIFWAIPRSQDPAVVAAGDKFKLSVQTPPRHFIDLPAPTLTVPLGAATHTTFYAHLLEYDSQRVWTALVDLGGGFAALKAAAEARWNVDMLNLFIFRSAVMADYAPIYGFIRASAGRHGFAPEFLHTVFMGEGVGGDIGLIESNRAHVPRIAFTPAQVISGFGGLGLDDIQDTLPALIAANYLDASFAGVLTHPQDVHNEIGELKHTADVVGWEAAVELVAAELHSRLDAMLAFCAANGVAITTEEQRRYLTYIRFNTGLATSQDHALHLNDRLKKWTGTRPTDGMSGRFNTLQRIAIAEWYEASGVYR